MALPSDQMTAYGNRNEPHGGLPGNRAAYGEDSAEAIRRRADVLLDEMMLGSVDMGAGDVITAHAEGAATSTPLYPSSGDVWRQGESAYTPHSPNDANGHRAPDGSPINGTAGAPAKETNGYPSRAAERYPATAEPMAHTAAPFEASGAGPGSTLISAEDRYRQMASPQSPTTNGGSASASSTAVRRQSQALASSMTVGVRASMRSNLLPRSTDVDITAIQQEISSLLTAVSTSLPPGHESIERSRHLLNKAQTLLQSDPTRSAEVDYYLQQVRRIVQRTRQTQEWSDVYRQRLLTYLLGWILLALVIITGMALFHHEVQQWVVAFFGLPASSPVVQQGVTVVIVAFAGALGAAVAMLFTMRRQSRREFGYFDRKYGLRGLLLPILGLFFGLLLALVGAVIYTFANVEPVRLWWAPVAPALLAFLLGFGQDWIYGAR